MPWLQLRCHTSREHADPVGDAFTELGAVSVTLMDAADVPILEPAPGETPLWDNIQLMILFDAETDAEAILGLWQHNPLSQHTSQLKFEILEDKDWEREWMDRFEPIHCGNDLWICPSWKPVPDESAVNVMLDPGLAFGTGTHPTTHLCLQWLAENEVKDKTVIDYGCGSGILAIAALKLGARSVIAIDIDPQAIQATNDNARRNQVADGRLTVGLPDILKNQAGDIRRELQSEIVLANILAGPLISLAEEISALCATHAKLVLSGLLDSQAAEISHCYQQWFKMEPVAQQEEWCRLVGEKR